METLNVTKDVKEKIDSARTSKLTTQNDIIEYLYDFYVKNSTLVETIDLITKGKFLMWYKEANFHGDMGYVIKYENELFHLNLSKNRPQDIAIVKIGTKMINDYINDPEFLERIDNDELVEEMTTAEDHTSDGYGGTGMLHSLRGNEKIISTYLEKKLFLPDLKKAKEVKK